MSTKSKVANAATQRTVASVTNVRVVTAGSLRAQLAVQGSPHFVLRETAKSVANPKRGTKR